MPNDAARRAEAKVSTGRKNTQAVRSSEHCETHRNMRAEATDHDRDGAGRGRLTADVPEKKCFIVGPAEDDF